MAQQDKIKYAIIEVLGMSVLINTESIKSGDKIYNAIGQELATAVMDMKSGEFNTRKVIAVSPKQEGVAELVLPDNGISDNKTA